MSCIEYSSNTKINTKSMNRGDCLLLKATGFNFSEVLFHQGIYRVELWGSSGGASTFIQINEGGRGGYTSGVYSLHEKKTFYFFIGTVGTNSNEGNPGLGGYNGGSDGGIDDINHDCASGGSGGSTDMRLVSDVSGQENSILSRIMVAGGGGSSGCYTSAGLGGHSGGINGTKGGTGHESQIIGGDGGGQTTGYSLLFGEKGHAGNEAGGSGGGGYWGGFRGLGGNGFGGAGGGGGSSYISGHYGCTSMDNETKLPLSSSVHPSTYLFTDSVIYQGNSDLPSVDSLESFEKLGHLGSGAVRITIIGFLKSRTDSCPKSAQSFPLCFITFIMAFHGKE